MFSVKDIDDQSRKIAIVTGANAGLGFETARFFAQKSMHVIMACRSKSKAEDAIQQIKKEQPKARLEFIALDLNSFESIRAFASEFSEKHSELHALVNNAGLMMPPFQTTEEGFESQFGVNYLGHFLLTHLLLPVLEQTNKARIVQLSSRAHAWGDIYYEDLNFKKKYRPRNAYSQSKLACLMFGYALERKLRSKQLNSISVSAHPGISQTELFRYLPSVLNVFAPMISQPADKGAEPQIVAALHPEISGGEYIGPNGFMEMKGEPVKVDSTDISKSIGKQEHLWDVSEELCGVRFFDSLG